MPLESRDSMNIEYIELHEVIYRIQKTLMVQQEDSSYDPWVEDTVTELIDRVISYININRITIEPYLGLPKDLYWIVKQATLNSYNRQLAEGLMSHTENGETMRWNDPGYDPLEPYYQALNDYIDGYSRRNTFEFF